jgi:divinyl protochlorophyllide a 8-vinyl-reductase
MVSTEDLLRNRESRVIGAGRQRLQQDSAKYLSQAALLAEQSADIATDIDSPLMGETAEGWPELEPTAVIGPNAIRQLQTALLRELGWSQTSKLFAAAGLARYLQKAPEAMVDEREVARLHRQVRLHCQPRQAKTIMTIAGDYTGHYILANRIPKLVVWFLRRLPVSLSAALLMQAIRKHAWTFAGSGSFSIARDTHVQSDVIIARLGWNPVVALESSTIPICDWHAAVFQRLFRDLVNANTMVTETHCCAAGDEVCEFRIQLRVR